MGQLFFLGKGLYEKTLFLFFFFFIIFFFIFCRSNPKEISIFFFFFLYKKIIQSSVRSNLNRFRTRMGNIRGFGGPLPEHWHDQSIRLQHRILQRMRDLGIIPVLPAFAGHVPRAFARLFPNAKMTKIDKWNKFEDKYCW